ncbi:arylesterase [Winogradskyella pelagia]|nr:arylesterase [Winogradskyella sp. DF17]
MLGNHKLLKFCYFIGALMVLNCGDAKKPSETEETSSKGEEDAKEVTTQITKTILCFGDSITAGYGLDDSSEAYPAILQQKIDSLGLNYTVVNSGLSGETSAGGSSRIDWVMRQNIDIFLLELGGNDGLRGIPLTETQSNLQDIINKVKEKNEATKVILAGMELPPNMGEDYTTQFRSVFSNLANENEVSFIPFILKGVGGIKELNQSDGIHPTAKGHKLVANTVWEVIKPMLKD